MITHITRSSVAVATVALGLVATGTGTAHAAAESPSWASKTSWIQGCYDASGARAWASTAGKVSVSDQCSDSMRGWASLDRMVNGSWVSVGTCEDTYNDNNTKVCDFSSKVSKGQKVRLRVRLRNADTGAFGGGPNKIWTDWTK